MSKHPLLSNVLTGSLHWIANASIYPATMIPLGDSEAARRLSPVNSVLIAGNLASFAFELRGSSVPLVAWFALVPARISHLQWSQPGVAVAALLTLVSSLFLHAGVLHVVGNMLYLLVFGPAVEARLGHARFFGFYLAAGIVACLGTVAMSPQSTVPVIGASGAIAGVLGGYLILYPAGRIRTLVPSSFMLRRVEIPAIFYLLVWFALQLYSGISIGPSASLSGGVAWWAHVGGFLFGVAAAPLMAAKAVDRRQQSPKRVPPKKSRVGKR